MNLDQLQIEVERRVRDEMLQYLIPQAVKFHVRKRSSEWADCECQYCVTKRASTLRIASHGKKFLDRESFEVISERDLVKKEERDKLNFLIEESLKGFL